MEFNVWLAFAISSLLIALIPGPGVASIIGFAMHSGKRVALASVMGMAVGNALAVTLSLAGAATILATSALAFNILKWAGAFYLIAIGLVAILKNEQALSFDGAASGALPRSAFLTNMLVGVLHPKTILFFVAFSAQFIRPDQPYLPQAVILVITFTAVAAASDTAYALTASRAARLFRSEQSIRWIRRAGGGVLVTAGCAIATIQK
ncbi:MAG: LysE family translocator [Sphingorhabdus sp.]|uniref:LysE family translocator n=1 Tax=Sphingorhabdus sp. TaxID=1902408 RepID=UPI0038FC33B8